MLLADLYDLTAIVAADPKKRSRVKPHPRPWKTVEVQTFGNTAGRSPDEVRSILDAAASGSLAA